ncbi:UNVERIFIED_CONTAM: hypothetical protein FKN15_055291 [Acipenser sinensis]
MGALSKTWALVLDVGTILLSTSKHVVTKGAPRPIMGICVFQASGNTGFLFTFPVLPFLGYEAYRHMNRSCTVYAQCKVEEVIEQADYLYDSGETEKLYHLLVKYRDRCFAFAELPWYQRKIAAMLFASPPSSTYEEALGYFLKAEEVDANFYSKNLLMLGKSYMMLKDQKSSLLWLSKAKDYPAHTEEDKQIHKEAVELLKTLGG